MLAVAHHRAVLDVTAGILQRSDLPVADIADEVRLVEQLEDKGGVGVQKVSQPQAGGLANNHEFSLSRFMRMCAASAAVRASEMALLNASRASFERPSSFS